MIHALNFSLRKYVQMVAISNNEIMFIQQFTFLHIAYGMIQKALGTL